MENLLIYNKVRAVPPEAQKPIGGGRLKGMTDINPMWRLKVLTEQFGACGSGWYPEIVKEWIEQGANGEIAAFVNINLHIKFGDEWGKPISGTGGSMLVSKETKGLYTSDECFKMAYTDAISVACKCLGVGADVYWQKDRTKYDQQITEETKQWKMSKDQLNKISELSQKKDISLKVKGQDWTGKRSSVDWVEADYTKVLAELMKLEDKK